MRVPFHVRQIKAAAGAEVWLMADTLTSELRLLHRSDNVNPLNSVCQGG